MKVTRKAYERMIDAQLKEWNMQVALLKAKADEVIAEAQLEFHNNFVALRRRQDEAGQMLNELKPACTETWEDLKAGDEKTGDAGKTASANAAPHTQ